MDQTKNTENGFNENGFNTVEEALEDLRQGKLILVTDDPDRENEGDFICAAEFATTENINFMAVHGKGLICMPMSEAYVEKLQLPQMVTKNTDNHETAFTVSIDYKDTTKERNHYELPDHTVVRPLYLRACKRRRPLH